MLVAVHEGAGDKIKPEVLTLPFTLIQAGSSAPPWFSGPHQGMSPEHSQGSPKLNKQKKVNVSEKILRLKYAWYVLEEARE